MNILVLSPYPERIAPSLAHDSGDKVAATAEPIHLGWLRQRSTDCLVSYGYLHIIGHDVIEAYGDRAINLHISFLPWNRGSDPNFWSWFDSTPKGVSIHVINRKLDTGPILVQRSVAFDSGETLETSYFRLRAEIEALFGETWPSIREGALRAGAQDGAGSYHKRRDKAAFMARLSNGWKTPVSEVEMLGRDFRAGRFAP